MLGEADAKFPGQGGDGIPPSPSRENPGQVYPKSDPKAAPKDTIPGTGKQNETSSFTGNPYLLQGALDKLYHSLTDVINIIQEEKSTMGGSSEEVAFLAKLKCWRNDITHVRDSKSQGPRISGMDGVPADEGGMFTD
ncbi:hypothetical protein SERLA73DRAFT_103054 [Serpula lacrymans var. lacrymans S7.3]|uniref:Uncharacterized protein n=2 Tax=Serpula lacrymans var. lacrymans TaxID=341189 RepID=F8PN15_SERL3|nr:uncharacterized protein SERLADRAFT_359915 [Serpula lacrymans var. lacrymans S7.9]EGO02997.1 hypothetical protein SERLA73DRAFT_103054 [Serpula lacrymans var. lacrymans S7.3]EGO28677.1 hypothetical protein SERLADRAFT_359915 [Serpula lacrymans var. lacrymans S7.9]